MAQVNSEQETMLAALQTKLNTYMEQNWLVCLHIDSLSMKVSHAMYLDEASVDADELNLSFGNFNLSVEIEAANNFNITMDTEYCFCIQIDNTEIYLDFLHK